MTSYAAVTSTLRLGSSVTLARYVLPRLLALFRSEAPAVAVTLLPLNSEQVAAALQRAELDLGFVEGTTRLPTLRYERLLYDELIAVRQPAPGGPPPAPLALAEALRHPLVLSEQGSGMLDVVETALRAQGVLLTALPTPPQHFVAHDDIKAYLAAVPNTLGFLPRRSVMAELLAAQLEEVPIRGLYLARQLLATWRATEPLLPPAQQFLDFCRAYYQIG